MSYPAARNQLPNVGTSPARSQRSRESSNRLPMPSVWVTPCRSGYWPVKIVGRLGTHASEPV
ncbi:Uncharacterised protein [Mycobacterium tuberculosis]|uniref:Uncharacterized protein n=1 Tax=Mycobacterium tuberculosis TaxID=1773 RepID=A0A916LE42_MYCTX|nr:Uncharacterised protein [Mycobacterium tuberculosis]COZ64389.1 Uncharacterised protein [Mycobacterium tuberculosis]